MKRRLLVFCIACMTSAANAQSEWPVKIMAGDGTIINIYQLQPESLKGNMLTARAAISVKDPGASNPVFGALWSKDRIATDRDNRVAIRDSVTVRNSR